MSNAVIDLTTSDDEVKEVSRPASKASNRTRRGRSGGGRGKGISQNATETEATEVQQSGGSSSANKSGSKPQSEQPKSNSLLSRLGMAPNENKKESTKSKRNSRDRPPGEKGKNRERDDDSRTQTEMPQTGAAGAHHRWSRSPSPNRPKEIPLSELPVEQLFYIDTGPPAGVCGEQEQPSPLGTGTGSTTPGTPGTGAIPNAKAIKKKLAKERKKERKASAEGKVSGDTAGGAPNEVEFIGGSALVVEDQAVTSDHVPSAAGIITTLSTSVTASIQAEVVKPTPDEGTKSNGLSLPEHVTLWVEGDNGPSLDDANEVLEIEDGIEYLDYGDDQATGVPRYFIPESATSKKACRTCGEEGHISRNCKKLICLTCGERDDHDTRNCPMRVVCFNCGGKGHLSSTCPQPRGRVGCDRCGSSKHIPQRCPEQFKTYVYLSEEERLEVLKQREALKDLAFGDGGEGYIAQHIWCYNCGNSGHWGDDCKDTKPYSAPTEPCAFGSFNASRGPFGDLDNTHGRSRDAPRPAWMDDDPHLQDVGRRAKEANMKRGRAAEASRIARDRDDDDWFSRAAGSSRDQRQASDRAKDGLPAKPKFSFQSRDNGNGSNRYHSGGHDSTRDRERDRRREKDRDKGRDNERRKRGRDYEDEKQYHRRRDDDDSRRYRDYRDWHDEERRGRRSGYSGSERRDRDRRGPQYRGSYA